MMHFITQAGILKAQHSLVDIVLIDRGIIDSKFYAWKFLKKKNVQLNNLTNSKNLLKKR